jgi:hypothetical protein
VYVYKPRNNVHAIDTDYLTARSAGQITNCSDPLAFYANVCLKRLCTCTVADHATLEKYVEFWWSSSDRNE